MLLFAAAHACVRFRPVSAYHTGRDRVRDLMDEPQYARAVSLSCLLRFKLELP